YHASAIYRFLLVVHLFFLISPRLTTSTLFPYTTLFRSENSVVADRVHLGDRVILQPGAVVGADGFGYATDGTGTHHKIPHLGTVDRKSTRLNSSHVKISYAVFCLKKKKTERL